MKTGVIVGKFYPMHIGHALMILSALKEVDALHVLVCTNPTQTWGNISPEDRCTAVVHTINTFNPEAAARLQVHHMDDSEMPDAPESDMNVSEVYAKYLVERFPDITHFLGSEPYVGMMAQCQDKEYVQFKRDIVPASGTRCRTEPQYFSEIVPFLRAKLTKRICVVGAESSGKSTTARKLSTVLNAKLVQEQGRLFMSTTDLTPEHFETFALNQYSETFLNPEKCIKQFQICDTDLGITQLYAQEYLGTNVPLVDMLRAKEKYDYYLVLKPNVQFVQDGLRIHEDQDKRNAFYEKVLDYVKKSKVPYAVIDQDDYDSRFDACIAALKNNFQLGNLNEFK